MVAATITFPQTMPTDSLFFTFLPTLVILCLFDNSHFNRCEVKSHCYFDLHFPTQYLLTICMSSMKKGVFRFPAHFFDPVVCLCSYWVLCFYVLWILTPYRYMICKCCLPCHMWPFHFVDGFLCFTEAFGFDVVPLV